MSELNISWDSRVINLEDAMIRVLGRKDMYKRWLDTFFNDDGFDLINEAFEKKDHEAAHRSMHKLKGTAGNLSVAAVYEQAKLIDDKLKTNADFDSLSCELEKLREYFYFAKKMYESNINYIMSYEG